MNIMEVLLALVTFIQLRYTVATVKPIISAAEHFKKYYGHNNFSFNSK